jgi:hypothetical protein
MEKQKKSWFIRGLLLLIILTMSCTCMPGNNNNNNDEETEVAVVEEVAEVEETSTPMPTNTVMVEPTTTVEPTLDEAVLETELAALMGNHSLREWSIAAYPGAEFNIDDRAEDVAVDDIVEVHVRNLSVQEPYYYEFYDMPPGLRYADVKEYFMDVVPNMGYVMASDMQGANEIYLLTFLDETVSPNRKVYIQYWRNSNLLMIIYQSPQ